MSEYPEPAGNLEKDVFIDIEGYPHIWLVLVDLVCIGEQTKRNSRVTFYYTLSSSVSL